MKRYNFFLDEQQLEQLERLPGNVSEHIRAAIDEYIKSRTPKAITSPSLKIKPRK